MISKSIPYQRFWHKLGNEVPLDENGFLINPGDDWFGMYYYQNVKVFTIDDLIHKECLLLLGEPGIGKSTELEKLENEEKDKKHKKASFTLRRFESKSDFKSSVLDDSTVSEWIKGNNEPLSIYLDGLDEALLEAKKISYGVVDVVKTLIKYGQVFLRLTCRTSDLPTEFQSEISSIFPESLKALELAPLRKEDVKLAAQEYGIDEEAFIIAIYEKELGALASRPITLNMLIKEYLDYGKISEDIKGVYEKGCLYLLEDTSDRKEAGYKSTLTQSQRLMVAERIAANLILCNYSNLYTGTIHELKKVDLHVDEIDTGKELIPITGENIEVHKVAIDEVINTSLFKPFGSGRYLLTHQTFAEYLTARYLLRNQFQLPQLESIFLHEDGVSRGVIPQLKEVVMWLASMHDGFFKKLIDVDPFILLKSTIWVGEKQKLNALVKSLIKKVSDRNRVPQYNRHFKFLKNLEFEGIKELLSTELSNVNYDDQTKRFILDIIGSIGIEEMAEELIDVVLDNGNELRLKNYALDILYNFDNNSELNSKLLSLLTSPGAKEYSLIANAVKCLYPTLLSSNRLIEIFEDSADLKENILEITGYHILKNSESKELAILLEWASENFPEKNYPSRGSAEFYDEIILKSIQHVDEIDVKKRLSKYIFKKIKKIYRLFDSTFSEKSYNKFLDHHRERRLIVEEIISISSKEKDENFVYKMSMYEHSLIVKEDFDWILGHVLAANEETEGMLWVKILDRLFKFYEPDHIQKVLLNKDNKFIMTAFHSLLIPIDIKSKEADIARKREAEFLVPKKNEPRKVINRDELIEKDLAELKKGNIDRFYWLDRNLSLEPESNYYTKDWELKSEEFNGWITASESLKQEIVKYAQVFLIETSPADKNWFKDVYSRASYRALRYIEDFDIELPGEISNNIWGKWLRPILYFELSGGFSLDQRFSKILNEKFQDDVIEFICELVKSENEEQSGHISVIPKLDSILTKELLDALFGLLNDENLKPRAQETIKERLLKSRHLDVLESIKSDLKRDNEDEYIINAFLLIKYSPDDFFEYVWEEFQKDTELSKKIAQKIASEDRHQHEKLKGLSEGQLAKLYIWLEKNYPVDEDSKKDGGITIRNMLSDFRSSVLNHLVSKGTEEACNKMQRVIKVLPDRKWLKIKFEEAKEIYRREKWVPIHVNHLMEMAINKSTRIIKNEHDLLLITLVKLDELQKRLQDQEQSEAIIYWNEDPEVKPKDENRMSDLIKNYLQDTLAKEGVILNREVEIERGSKTDIHITALIPDGESYNAIKLVIEAKGCWHKELKTAFKSQLIEKYLQGNGIKAGIYLVGWFICDKWNREDYRFKQTPKFTFEKAADFFTNQQEELDEQFPDLLIRSKTIDISI